MFRTNFYSIKKQLLQFNCSSAADLTGVNIYLTMMIHFAFLTHFEWKTLNISLVITYMYNFYKHQH